MSKTVFILGATGGTANACLTHILRSHQYQVIALVRRPAKLLEQLHKQQHIDEATTSNNLSIVQGNATKIDDIKRALLTRVTAGSDNTIPSTILTALGASPVFTFNVRQPLNLVALDQPTLCTDAATALLTALERIQIENPHLAAPVRPSLTFISSTGISDGPEDVPLALRGLYHSLLAKPHRDKRAMETVFQSERARAVLSLVTGVRPTLLVGSGVVDQSNKGLVRAGIETMPAVGYTITRAAVGRWIFEHIIEDRKEGDRSWRGEMCSLTS